MEHEKEHDADQDLAEPGHDTPDQDAPEGDSFGQAEHDDGDSSKEARNVVREGLSLDLPDFGEYHEATPEVKAGMILACSWQGHLPAPEDFTRYPSETQRKNCGMGRPINTKSVDTSRTMRAQQREPSSSDHREPQFEAIRKDGLFMLTGGAGATDRTRLFRKPRPV